MAEVENIQFDFDNRVFAVEGAVFKKANGNGAVALYIPMGEAIAAITIKQIKSGFDIPEDSKDNELLGYVTQGLEFVRKIYPGDSVPSEVISGEASWMVDEKFVAAAKARVMMQLVAWITGEDFETVDLRDILLRADNPETKKVVQEAFNDIAEKLGIGTDRREEVVQMVDRFAHELSYMEALRSEMEKVDALGVKFKKLHKKYQDDNSMAESLLRTNTLIEKPIQAIANKFDEFDATIGEILNTLRQYDAKIEYVRKIRDELRQTYLLWSELLGLWERCDESENTEVESAIRESYRFVAQHFSQTESW